MEIFIKTLSGRTLFTLEVESSDTVDSVKEKIQNKVGIPPDHLSLTFAGELLIASRTLDYYDIHDKSTLMLIRHGAKVSVNIRQLKRLDFDFEISDTTVDSVKGKIHAEAGIPPHQQRLFYKDELLTGDRTLAGESVGGGELTIHEHLKRIGERHICVKFLKEETFTFYNSDSIDNVKAKIEDVVGVPRDKQTLIFEGELLEGGRTLADYQIRMDSTLDLRDGNMKIYVKTLTGKVFPLYVESSKTIYDVMEKISVVEGIPSYMPRLFFNDQQLERGRTLASYNVPEESTLFMVLRLTGGAGITITIEPLLGKTLILRIEPASNPVTEITLPSPTLPSGVDDTWSAWLEYLLSFLTTIKGYSEKWGHRISWVLFSRTRKV